MSKIAILGDFNLLNDCDLSKLNINSIQINSLSQGFYPTYYLTIKSDLFNFNKKLLNTELTSCLISPLIKNKNKNLKRSRIIDVKLIKKTANINIVAIYQAILFGYKQIFLFGIKVNKADKDWINLVKYANKFNIQVFNCGKNFNVNGINNINYNYENNDVNFSEINGIKAISQDNLLKTEENTNLPKQVEEIVVQ